MRAPALLGAILFLATLPSARAGASTCPADKCDNVVPEGGFSEGNKALSNSAEHALNPAKTEALMLIGGIVFIMVLFYLTNSPDAELVLTTWQMLSSVISIFCAVLLYSCVTAVLALMGLAVADVKVGGIVLFFFFLGLNLILFATRNHPDSLHAFGTLCGHITGFAIIDLYGAIEETWWGGSVLLTIAFIPFAALMITLILLVFGCIRDHLAKAKGGDEWVDSCEDFENDAIALALGFFVSRSARYMIDGKLPPMDGMPIDKTTMECWGLFFFAVFFAVLVMVTSSAVRHFQDTWRGGHPKMLRFLNGLNSTFGMSVAWCLLYTGQWSYWNVTSSKGLFGASSMMTAKIVMALFDSVVALILMIVIDVTSSRCGRTMARSFKSLLTALGLLLGFSWEKTFDLAVDHLGELMAGSDSGALKTWVKIFMSIAIAVVVLPAWQHIILPKVADVAKEEAEIEAESDEEEELASRG